MDMQLAFNIVATAAGFLAGFLINTLWNAVQGLRKDLNELRVHLAESYLPKSDFKEFADAMLKKLDRIEAKLDSKADK